VPKVSGITPPAVTAGRTRVEITLTGTNFNAGSQVLFGTTALASHMVSATSLLAVVPASLLIRAGTNAVTVVNSAPGGGTSAPVTFTITL
jgi:trimeric autotransporter adhesin